MAKIGYFKSFKPEDVSLQPFVANKVWTVTGGALNASIQLTGSLITGSNHYIASFSSASKNSFISASSSEPVSNTRYKFILHSNIDQLFYRYNSRGMENDVNAQPCQMNDPGRQHRDLHSQAHIISIPQSLWGEGIKANTIKIMDSGVTPTIRLEDDGYTNLIDKTISTSSMVGKENLMIHIPFSDGFRYDNPVDNPISQGRYYGEKRGLDYKGPYPYNVSSHKVKYKKGMNGYALNTQGVSGSYVLAKRQGPEQTRLGIDQEFAIGMWLKIPTSQSVSQSREGAFESYKNLPAGDGNTYFVKRRPLSNHTENVIISKKQKDGLPYPFEISVGNSWGSNDGKIIFRRSTGVTTKTIISADKYNDNTWRHFLFQKTGSKLEMYCNGQRKGLVNDFTDTSLSTISDAPIQIGAARHIPAYESFYSSRPGLLEGSAELLSDYEPMVYRDSMGGGIKYKTSVENMIRPFTGSIDELRLYNSAIPSASLQILSSSITNTNIVGNIFYDYGLAVITDPREPYTNMFSDTSKWYINFQNKHTIYESEYYCHIKDDEFESSMNPTLRIDNSIKDYRMKGFASSSNFSPYITSVGLYNDEFDLLAVAKMATPIKKPKNMDTTIVIRFDR